VPTEIETQSYQETIAKRGFRFTKQRLEVYQALLEKRDHPTATEVYARVKERIPSISLATVYNCLETLAECGLAKHVNIDRAPSRYCPNLEEHGHFYCEQCGAVIDVPFKNRKNLEETWAIPADSIVTHHEVAFRGLCPACATNQASKGTPPGLEPEASVASVASVINQPTPEPGDQPAAPSLEPHSSH
jgi:Fur family peroxide stress response transcriptional regulator